ncbi:MoxR family ATPase [Nodularia sp. UHCC 0506]|uniref:AAA family ATPase n=1 Tax=Nodularia sp. UHCC 0506 TaxID=3110243 RepID=UPI002B200655|nr:MoxR family ATPase [Nodularia sp. UHCC 0506]MEA5512550.1 MoxR family ATPase [Nodularia sp. UHCC 0506]
MNKPLDYKYTGKKLENQSLPDSNANIRGQKQYPYLPDENLVKAVNLALYLQRPLLLQGEPGCGKTLLARAIAREFKETFKIKDKEYPYFPWYIKSTTQAKEGLYIYDAIGRLRDAQLVATVSNQAEKAKISKRCENPEAYITWGALGNAFREETYRPIILIDEIDKADIDFPNDLLRELDEGTFTITETQTEIPTKQQPIVIITSNSEKELPDAFLRRCIFYYLDFPEKDRLIDIVNAHFDDSLDMELVTAAVEKFIGLRETGASRRDGKKASTSELLDLISSLKHYAAKEINAELTTEEISPDDIIKKALAIIKNLGDNLPLLGTLLKTKDDQDYYKK